MRGRKYLLPLISLLCVLSGASETWTSVCAERVVHEESFLQEVHAVPEHAAAAEASSLRDVCPASSLDRLTASQYSSFISAVERSARRHEIDEALIASVIAVESNCRPDARSPVGAIGLMQLMPKTAAWLGARNPRSITENVDAGTKYLRMMLRTFDGDLKLALAAYNAGPVAVHKHNKQVPPYEETKSFITKVLSRYSKLVEGTDSSDVVESV